MKDYQSHKDTFLQLEKQLNVVNQKLLAHYFSQPILTGSIKLQKDKTSNLLNEEEVNFVFSQLGAKAILLFEEGVISYCNIQQSKESLNNTTYSYSINGSGIIAHKMENVAKVICIDENWCCIESLPSNPELRDMSIKRLFLEVFRRIASKVKQN